MTAVDYRLDLQRICREVSTENRRLLIGNETILVERDFESGESNLSDRDYKVKIVESICQRLYKAFYIRNRETIPGNDLRVVPIDLVSQLKIANGTSEAWDLGWEIYHFGSDGRVYVKRGDQSRVAWAGTFMLENWTGTGARVGDIVKLRIFPFTETPLESFFHTFGATLSDQFDEYNLLRFYFNIESDAVVDLLAYLSLHLNRYRIPYHFKALARPEDYKRADAAVLYIASCHYQIVSHILSGVSTPLDGKLRSAVPMFTKELACGIGASQDPGNGVSFGMHRCRLIAQALLESCVQGKNSPEEKQASVEQFFDRAGVDMDAPYLNPGEFDVFAQPMFVGGVVR